MADTHGGNGDWDRAEAAAMPAKAGRRAALSKAGLKRTYIGDGPPDMQKQMKLTGEVLHLLRRNNTQA